MTHLKQFFSSYPKYEYDPSGPASQQFRKLQSVYKGDRGLYTGYNRAMGLAFGALYGTDLHSIESWQSLCRAVEFDPIPDSIRECQRLIEDAHVNLVDLLDVHTTGEPVRRFKTEKELSVYTLRLRKFFPRDPEHKGRLLQFLLRRIYHPPAENLIRRDGKFVERDQ
ncbi:hypothetical protein C8J57DRAFT_1076776 [Mycena rebaudengoi]|nr:hypothetical protein C8J57DRAFT_1076776 [Mycena rebaudengoi]